MTPLTSLRPSGRPVLNANGESVQVFQPITPSFRGHAVSVRTSLRTGSVQPLPRIGMMTGELALERRDAATLILNLADAIGMVCELRERAAKQGGV